MPQFLVPTANVLIFTDFHFSAGGLTDGRAVGTALSQGAILLLRDVFFPQSERGRTRSASAPLAAVVGAAFPTLREAEAGGVGASFANAIPFLALADTAPVFGDVTIADDALAGSIELSDGVATYLPAGRVYSRTVGAFRVAFSVGAESLAGIVRPDPSLQAVGLSDRSIQVLLQQTEGPGCGACGVCGACVACAEINYAVAGAAAVALVALQAVERSAPFVSFAADGPAPGSSLTAVPVPKAELAAELRQRIRPLLEIPDVLAGTAAPERREP